MNIPNNISDDNANAAKKLGDAIRSARLNRGWTIAELAEKLGRTREWLNRVELGYCEYGEYKPISVADVNSLIDLLENNFKEEPSTLIKLAEQADEDYRMYKRQQNRSHRSNFGKLTQTEVVIGEKQIVQAILDLIQEQHADAIIRNTGIKPPGHYLTLSDDWIPYRAALGQFLEKNPNGMFKRVEFSSNPDQLEHAKAADKKLNGIRELNHVHNAKIKFFSHNPLQLHVVIGQREAILALPQTTGQAGSNVALLVRDKIFVEALRIWYDEVLWDAPGEYKTIDFSKFDHSFDEVKKMYDF
jgi:transcriptional regulator with XRE-family HTH domain